MYIACDHEIIVRYIGFRTQVALTALAQQLPDEKIDAGPWIRMAMACSRWKRSGRGRGVRT